MLLSKKSSCSLLFFFLTILVPAKTIYVGPSGKDMDPGTLEQPYKTLQFAVDMLFGGDTLYVREGTYELDKAWIINCQGQASNPVVVQSYCNEEVLVDGSDYMKETGKEIRFMHRKGLIHIEGAKYVKIKGFTVQNSHNIGIVANGENTEHVDIIDCKSHGSYGSGIALWYSRHVKVLHCEITGANDQELRPAGIPLRREGPHEGLTVAGAEYFEVAYNEIHHCKKEGIDVKEVSKHGTVHHNYIHDMPRQGLYVDSWFGLLKDVEFYQNTVHDCEWGMAISAEGKDSKMENVKIHHNLFYDNKASGIFFGVWGHDQEREEIYIYNNTIYHNGSANHWAGSTGGIDLRSSNLKKVYIYNNICSQNHSFEIATWVQPGEVEPALKKRKIVISHNLSHDFKNEQSPTELFPQVYGYLGGHPVQKAPGFVHPDKDDFSLQAGSPAIGNAMPEAPIGDYEYLGAIPPEGKK